MPPPARFPLFADEPAAATFAPRSAVPPIPTVRPAGPAGPAVISTESTRTTTVLREPAPDDRAAPTPSPVASDPAADLHDERRTWLPWLVALVALVLVASVGAFLVLRDGF